jgi:hypothetical protein
MGNGLYTFSVSDARDPAGSVLDFYSQDSLVMTPDTSHQFQITSIPAPVATATATVTPSAAVTLTLPNNCGQIALPAGLVTTTTVFTYSQFITPTQTAGVFAFAGRSFTLEATDSAGMPVTNFSRQFTITLNYSDADWQAAGIPDENSLDLFYWDGATWTATLPCTGCVLDTVNNRLIAVLNHLTEFALLGDTHQTLTVIVSRTVAAVELKWTHVYSDVQRYEVYRSTAPYFAPGDPGSMKLADVSPPALGSQASYTDSRAFDPPGTNYFYTVHVIYAAGPPHATSGRIGLFNFALQPGSP